ncbi:MAG TPA: VOC family protein [Gaiellaceae bacterium]|jgi:catechol 2,3-dioxygenase-like lactoylglutathione lyase family enzyme
MSEPLNAVGAITMFVEDRERAREFYGRVFGVDPMYEDEDAVAFKLENMVVNLLVEREADDLIGPAPVGRRDAGSRFQLTIWVEDADAVAEELAGRGVELLNGPKDRAWGMRTAAFADPDGHIWEVAAKISS